MSLSLDEQYWSKRYAENETAWDIGYISTPLKTYFDQLKNKKARILIPGAGNAYEAEYLADAGFTDVTVCDLSAAPLANLRKRLSKKQIPRLVQKDFFELQGTFDLIVEQTFFCALDPSLRPAYFQKMAQLLAPRGKLMGLLFNDRLNNDRPPFGGSLEEYHTYVPAVFEKLVFATCYNSITPRAGREIFMLLRKKAQ